MPPHMASTHKVHANSIKDYIETMIDFTCMPYYCYSFAVGIERREPDLRKVLLSMPRGCRMQMFGSFGASLRTFPSLSSCSLSPSTSYRRHSWFKPHLLPPKLSSAILQYSYQPHWSKQSISSVSQKDCHRRSLPILDAYSMVEYMKTPPRCAYPRKVELTDLIDFLVIPTRATLCLFNACHTTIIC